MFNFCSNKRLKSFFIITFFLAGVFVDITKCEARCLEHTDIECSWISWEVFKTSTWGVQGLDCLLSIMPLDSAWAMHGVPSSDCKALVRFFPVKEELLQEQDWVLPYFYLCDDLHSLILLRCERCRQMTWCSFISPLPFLFAQYLFYLGRTAAEFRIADMENLGLSVRMAHHHLLDVTQSALCQADIIHWALCLIRFQFSLPLFFFPFLWKCLIEYLWRCKT